MLDYLSSCLGPVSKKVNINKAAACELTRMLGISNEQATAIVAYREKNGGFKDLDGVKKVEGVDPAALDAKKRFDRVLTQHVLRFSRQNKMTVRATPATVVSPEIHRRSHAPAYPCSLLYRVKGCCRQRKIVLRRTFQQLCHVAIARLMRHGCWNLVDAL